MKRVFVALFLFLSAIGPVAAQEAVWLQIEAQPTLNKAQERVRAYSAQLENVAGFSLGRGWYGIVLGPYSRADADQLLRRLRAAGQIPRDSFIAFDRSFGQQFWPVGIAAETSAQPLPGVNGTPDAEADTAVAVAPEPIQTPDETLAEARASEAQLDRDQRKDLQIALQWAGFYTAAIDGSYGRGTRSSMREWQEANNHEPTGVLTSGQRRELIGAYNAVLDGMNLRLVRDDATGIQMQIPTGVVAFADYDAPFARFEPKGDLGAQVLLISQPGDQTRMFGLYEILQTLAIFPKDGERSRNDRFFEIEGIGDGLHSYATARLEDNTIKGFALIWPDGDDERRRRVLQEMQDSFETFDGVLDPSLSTPGEEQAIDLVAGLAVRKPKLSRTGFFIDGSGTVVTTTEAIGSCNEVTIDTEYDAEVIHTDTAAGIAVLRPLQSLAPLGVVAFQTAVPRLQSEIAVAGYPYGGVLVTPSLTFGKLADIRGLNGEDEVKRLNLTAQDGDAGGPVFDNGGAVLGMLLPKSQRNGQVLPDDVSFSVDSEVILASLDAAGIGAQRTDSVAFMPPEVLTSRAADQTVLVSCW